MKINPLLVIIFLLLLIPTQSSKMLKAVEEDFREYIGYSSALTNDTTVDMSKPEVIPMPLCSCAGTGKVMSPDGITQITCPCGNNCKCAKNQGEEPPLSANVINENNATFIYYFSAKWCNPCKIFKDKDVPLLKEKGMKFGDKYVDGINVVFVDIDNDTAGLWRKYGDFDDKNIGQLPNTVVIKDGKKVASTSGYMNSTAFKTYFDEKTK